MLEVNRGLFFADYFEFGRAVNYVVKRMKNPLVHQMRTGQSKIEVKIRFWNYIKRCKKTGHIKY